MVDQYACLAIAYVPSESCKRGREESTPVEGRIARPAALIGRARRTKLAVEMRCTAAAAAAIAGAEDLLDSPLSLGGGCGGPSP